MKDTVLILRPPLAMATVSRSTENTAIEKWPPLVEAARDPKALVQL